MSEEVPHADKVQVSVFVNILTEVADTTQKVGSQTPGEKLYCDNQKFTENKVVQGHA